MLSTCVGFGARGRRSRRFNGEEVEVLTLRNPSRQLVEMSIVTRYADDITSFPPLYVNRPVRQFSGLFLSL